MKGKLAKKDKIYKKNWFYCMKKVNTEVIIISIVVKSSLKIRILNSSLEIGQLVCFPDLNFPLLFYCCMSNKSILYKIYELSLFSSRLCQAMKRMHFYRWDHLGFCRSQHTPFHVTIENRQFTSQVNGPKGRNTL